MYRTVREGRGFDLVIVVVSSKREARFWQARLEASRGEILSRHTEVLCLDEGWEGGAGQLLGTLHAWQRAQECLNARALLESGGSVAIYQAAGQGTRMAPLCLAEGGDKSAVRLPRVMDLGDRVLMSVLEAVIFQTQPFAPSRAGRLCVFWADQIFIPSRPMDRRGEGEVEILGIRAEVPVEERLWRRGWQGYGLLIRTPSGEVLQREKQTFDQFQELRRRDLVRPNSEGRLMVGRSLGSFSLSGRALELLLEEYEEELTGRRGRLDTDPHLWMPLTSSLEEFAGGGGDPQLWERVQRLGQRLRRSGLPLIEEMDLGEKTYFWDLGQARLYMANLRKLLDDTPEGECMRRFFGVELQGGSLILASEVRGSVEQSLILDSRCQRLRARRGMVVSVQAHCLKVVEGLVYGCVEPAELEVGPGEVLADCFLPERGRVRMRTALERSGKEDWHRVLPGNPCSYSELQGRLRTVELQALEEERCRWGMYLDGKLSKFLEGVERRPLRPQPDNLVERPWGGGFLERFKGLSPSGRLIGESWECSGHWLHPSQLCYAPGRYIPLHHLIPLRPRGVVGRHGEELRVLLKFIEAREDLSVQVHPSSEQARELGESEGGKEEAWLVLRAEAGSRIYLGFQRSASPEELRAALEGGENLAERYLNILEPQPGEVFLVPSGTVHALGRGVVVAELQQPSDITYRLWDWNRQPPRTLHWDQALRVLDLEAHSPDHYRCTPRRLEPGRWELVRTARLWMELLEEGSWELSTEGFPWVIACLEGKARVRTAGGEAELPQGWSLLMPAAAGDMQIEVEGRALRCSGEDDV